MTRDRPDLRPDWSAAPLPNRLPADAPQRDEIMRRHRLAVESGLPVYADPASGLSVFTADFLAARAYCCSSGCRHCPYVSGA